MPGDDGQAAVEEGGAFLGESFAGEMKRRGGLSPFDEIWVSVAAWRFDPFVSLVDVFRRLGLFDIIALAAKVESDFVVVDIGID